MIKMFWSGRGPAAPSADLFGRMEASKGTLSMFFGRMEASKGPSSMFFGSKEASGGRSANLFGRKEASKGRPSDLFGSPSDLLPSSQASGGRLRTFDCLQGPPEACGGPCRPSQVTGHSVPPSGYWYNVPPTVATLKISQ
jgi:hypothetical protein